MKLNDRVAFARDFAALLHADQGQTYDGKPYVVHLDAVVRVLINFDFIDKNLLAAGYLHDAIEDTGLEPQTVVDLFGDRVAELVNAVTDAEGANRKERKALTYPKIKSTPGATAIKLADRIANVEHSQASGNLRMQKMYKKEYDEFQTQLRTLGELEPMWACLQSLHLKTP